MQPKESFDRFHSRMSHLEAYIQELTADSVDVNTAEADAFFAKRNR